MVKVFQQRIPVALRQVGVGLREWSAPISQLIVVAWCCSTRMSWASCTRASAFMRSATCLVRSESSSSPFIRMARTRVNASSSSLLMGLPTMSFQAMVWRPRGTPLS
jgi:hypothetical protein